MRIVSNRTGTKGQSSSNGKDTAKIHRTINHVAKNQIIQRLRNGVQFK